MKFGCCLNMIAKGEDGIGLEHVEALAAMGFDYAELPLTQMMALDDSAFEALKETVRRSGIPCETCNNFFPRTLRLTGDGVDLEGILRYAQAALFRAASLGVQRVVFGSGGARNVPDGFPMERGYRQVVELLQRIDPLAKANGITIVIEPLRKKECNLINTFEEGCRLADDVGTLHVKVLADLFHIVEENEPFEHLERYGRGRLKHVHLARPEGRAFPDQFEEAGCGVFFTALRRIGYDARISLEAHTRQFAIDAPKALRMMRSQFP